MKNIYITLGIVVALVFGGLIGYAIHPSGKSFGSTNNAAGTTFSTAKVGQVNMTITTGAATSSSILNTDSSDRYIVDSFVACNTLASSKTAYTGTGLANLLFRMATTSTAITTNLTDTNSNYAAVDTVSTTTVVSYVSSSTEGVITGYSRVWDAGTYLTIQPNATNTAVCTVGVHYIGS